MTTISGILTFYEQENSFYAYLSLEKADFLDIYILMGLKISCSAELCMEKVCNLGARIKLCVPNSKENSKDGIQRKTGPEVLK